MLVLGATAEESLPEGDSPVISDQALLEKLTEGQSPRSILEELGVSGKQRRALYARLLALADTTDDESHE